jgi:hypothetical protein
MICAITWKGKKSVYLNSFNDITTNVFERKFTNLCNMFKITSQIKIDAFMD